MSGHIYSIYVELNAPEEDGVEVIDSIAEDITEQLKGHGYNVHLYHDGTY